MIYENSSEPEERTTETSLLGLVWQVGVAVRRNVGLRKDRRQQSSPLNQAIGWEKLPFAGRMEAKGESLVQPTEAGDN